MDKERISVAGMSVLLALGLAVWEIYFFWFAGSLTSLEGPLGWFSTERLGFNMAWLASIYLTFQLIAVPFSIPTSRNFIVPVGSPFFVGDTFTNGGRNVQEFKVGFNYLFNTGASGAGPRY